MGGMGGMGGGQMGGAQPAGNENRGWRDNRAAAPSAPQPGAQAGAQVDRRGWRGDANGQWQNRAPRTDTPAVRPDPTPGNPARYGQVPGGGNWQGRPTDRGDANRWDGDRDRGRNDGNRWTNDAARNGYPGSGINRAYGNQGAWQNGGDRAYARPNNGWQNGNGRLSANERWRDQNRWNRDWRRDNRYDWSSYRQYNRNAYHLPAYRAPYGWNGGYSRYSIGIYLGSSLFGSSYWIDDPYSYRLPEAYGTLRWIRYYDDALLVDIRDGYVVDVLHDFFW